MVNGETKSRLAINWRPGHPALHESLWSVLHKICVLNHVSGWAAVRLFSSKRQVNADLRFSRPFSLDRISLSIGEGPQWADYATFDKMSDKVGEKCVRRMSVSFLRFCPDCMDVGYHTILFQIGAERYCPIHRSPLRDHCPSCGERIPYALPSRSARPFSCHCGYRLWWHLGASSWPKFDMTEGQAVELVERIERQFDVGGLGRISSEIFRGKNGIPDELTRSQIVTAQPLAPLRFSKALPKHLRGSVYAGLPVLGNMEGFLWQVFQQVARMLRCRSKKRSGAGGYRGYLMWFEIWVGMPVPRFSALSRKQESRARAKLLGSSNILERLLRQSYFSASARLPDEMLVKFHAHSLGVMLLSTYRKVVAVGVADEEVVVKAVEGVVINQIAFVKSSCLAMACISICGGVRPTLILSGWGERFKAECFSDK